MSRRALPSRTVESSSAVPGQRDATTPTDDCTIDEMVSRYPGQWIVMRVTGYDERHLVARGRILAHTRSHTEAHRILSEHLQRSTADDAPLYHFDAYPRITTGDDLRRSLAELVVGPDPKPWRGLR